MDKKKIRRIVAREGLILLGFIILAVVVRSIAYNTIYNLIPNDFILEQKLAIADRRLNIATYSPYCLYIFIRFIIWAVRTLREE